MQQDDQGAETVIEKKRLKLQVRRVTALGPSATQMRDTECCGPGTATPTSNPPTMYTAIDMTGRRGRL